MEYLEENNISFIIRLDWKSEIEELMTYLQKALKDNFNELFTLTPTNDFNKNDFISVDGVFEMFDRKLAKHDFQISLINTNSDEYVFILYRAQSQMNIEILIEKIRYNHQHFR